MIRNEKNDTSSEQPRLCFVGPALGRNPGWVTTQGEILADRFMDEGWNVRETSSHPRRLGRLVDTIRSLWRWRRDTDIVVLSVFSGPAFVMADISSLIAKALSIPTIMVLHGGSLPEHRRRFPRWTRRVLNRADQVVAPSTFLTETVEGDRAVEVIPNLVDLEMTGHRPRSDIRPRLFWMRTLHPIYNPEMAIRALAKILVGHPDATLTMAGQEKGSLENIRSEVEQLGLEDKMRFVGFLGPEAKEREFRAHDIYLHTNRVDNMPVSVLEAAAAGLPIIATEVGGIPDLLEDEKTALFVPDDDADAMAQAVDRLLSDPSLVERLCRNARGLAEKSSWPAVRTRWIALFEQVLVKKR